MSKKRQKDKSIDSLPKSVKKAIRYIKQDADKEMLEIISRHLNHAIYIRRKRLG
jgi:hypothetical protein